MPPKTTLWEADPHTLAKIRIVEEYLKAWLPILSTWNGRIVYIDGFSGPGKYTGGEKGSPIVALETALNHDRLLKDKELCFLFIEKEKDRFEYLDNQIKSYSLPSNIKVGCVHDHFEETLNNVLGDIESKDSTLAPAFLFVDPFGIKGVSFDTLQRYMNNPRCEIFINFMFEFINRFASRPEFTDHMDKLFGTELWRECLDKPTPELRQNCYIDLFDAKMNEITKFVWKFEMIDQKNKTKYFLYYGTNHIRGLEKMKDAMWKISPTGTYAFSDRDYPQVTLFEKFFDPSHLQTMLMERLKGCRIDISDLEENILRYTPYRKAHTRQALIPLEKADKIKVYSRKRKLTYPPGTIVQF